MSQSSEAPETARVTRSSTNPRRRVRTSENDTLKTTAPRRKRTKLSQEQFQPRASTEHVEADAIVEEPPALPQTNGNGNGHGNGHGSANGFHHHHHAHSNSTEMDVVVRGKKPATKRAMRGDGATVLTGNKCYSVRLLPSTPKELRQDGVEYRGSLDRNGRALAVTRQKAIIWEYHAHSASTPKVFDIPFTASPREELPFGALVPSGGVSSTDAGLVLISATTGKVVFYESIDRAATIGRFQDKNNGVDGVVSLYSAEKVVDLVSADHAGFIIVLDSGRTAQLALRDAQGKPKVTINFLKVTEQASGSFFSSLKGMVKSDWKKNVAAVHTRALKARGQIQAVSLTEGGEVLTWELDWSGRSQYQATAQISEQLVEELRVLAIPELEGRLEKVTALDFAILDKPVAGDGMELAVVGDQTQQPLHLMVLLRIGGKSMQNYAVAALTLVGSEVTVYHINYIEKYHGRPQRRPRLIVPKPEHSVFVVFEDATVLLATREPATDSPDAQLSASYVPPVPFEESIYLRQGKDLAAQDVAAEFTKGGSHASCISFVKSAGLVRYSSVDVNALPEGSQLSAKSQIEQAVFYGTLQPDNIIDFTNSGEKKYALDKIEEAALEISDEILRADTPPQYVSFISHSPPSMEQGLAAKARGLKALAGYLRRSYPALPKSTMWRLMWDAERVAAGQQLWLAFEEHVAATSVGKKRKATLLDEVCAWLEDEHFAKRPELANEDPVRRFFIGGLHHLEKVLGFVKIFMGHLKESESEKQPDEVLKLAIQVNDVWCKALDTAFVFRGEDAADYGVLLEHLTDGVLTDPVEYQDLPEFWTSTEKIIKDTTQIAEQSRYFATKYFGMDLDEIGNALAAELAAANPRLSRIFCLQAQEAVNWRKSRPGQQDREFAAALEQRYDELRYEQLRSLAGVGQAKAGMELAEKWRDMRTLTDVVIAEDQYLADALANPHLGASERETAIKSSAELKKRIRSYFEKFGEVWAEPFFEHMFSGASIGAKLNNAQTEWPAALKTWLRKEEWRGKLCWINDITDGSDFEHASKVLQREGLKREQDVWAKKVELSMGKLAMLAAEEDAALEDDMTRGGAVQPPATNGHKPAESMTNALRLIGIQGCLDKHIYSTLIGSLDRDAEILNVMNRYATHLDPGLETHHNLLETGLNGVIDHKVLSVEQLVDVLTLMDLSDGSSENGIPKGGNFVLALQAIDAAVGTGMELDKTEILRSLVWKRVYIYDDWNSLARKMGRKKVDADRREVLRDTALWGTLELGITNGLFTIDGLHVSLPDEVLGVGCKGDNYRHRHLEDAMLQELVREEKVMDEILVGLVGDCGLQEFVRECLRGVQEDLRFEAAGMNGNGHVNGYANGHANGFKVEEVDEDEDMF